LTPLPDATISGDDDVMNLHNNMLIVYVRAMAQVSRFVQNFYEKNTQDRAYVIANIIPTFLAATGYRT
jgi:hypothetical protein